LNEPHPTSPQAVLLDFYKQGIDIVRAHAPDTYIIVSDAFRPDKWQKTFLKDAANVWLDMHLYQVFDAADKKMPMHKHIRKAQRDWAKLIDKVQKSIPVLVGEWSLGLDPSAFRGMDDFERDKALQAYAKAQTDTFKSCAGWFFWNYKTETMAGWDYRECVARGWIQAASS
jgi:glucan 1,3-beta-glucosidase